MIARMQLHYLNVSLFVLTKIEQPVLDKSKEAYFLNILFTYIESERDFLLIQHVGLYYFPMVLSIGTGYIISPPQKWYWVFSLE